MLRALLSLPLLLLAAAADPDEVPFEPATDTFSDAAACQAHLGELADAARHEAYDAVEGPYEIEAGDVRIHMVRAEGAGHRISEHRCLAERLSGRSWSHVMQDETPDFTIESVARSAPWLKKGAGEQ
jgi:hypothetical protein